MKIKKSYIKYGLFIVAIALVYYAYNYGMEGFKVAKIEPINTNIQVPDFPNGFTAKQILTYAPRFIKSSIMNHTVNQLLTSSANDIVNQNMTMEQAQQYIRSKVFNPNVYSPTPPPSTQSDMPPSNSASDSSVSSS